MSGRIFLVTFLGILITLSAFKLRAETAVKPFILASSGGDNFEQVIDNTRSGLAKAGFEILGSYSPYPQAHIIIFTNSYIKNIATQSQRGGYGGALRVAITRVDNGIQVSYTNPLYWSNAYRLADNLQTISDTLASVLGKQQQYGSGKEVLTESDMREYHYTFMMEYFDDPSQLAYYDDHNSAVKTVEARLASGVAGAQKVYRLDLGKDSEGRQMTLFGVGLAGEGADDCSSDSYIMNQIDKSSPRHTAHLPYELLVYGSNIEALYARFRIAISWPHLPMMSSDTGATFFSIMCAPGAIEQTLKLVAGGEVKSGKNTEK